MSDASMSGVVSGSIEQFQRKAFVGGRFVNIEEATVSIFDRGFLFADGIYEVTAVIDGRLVDNASHLERLQRSTKAIDLPLPLSLERIEALQTELVALNRLRDGMVYLQVTRGAAERNFAFPEPVSPTLVMFTQEKDIIGASSGTKGIRVKTVEDGRWHRRDIKSVGLLAQVLAKREAASAGCEEAWLVARGEVTEGASSTAFIITDYGTIVSRPDSFSVLSGCTAKALMVLAKETGLEISLRSFSIEEALAAREAFSTSASTFVQPVIAIDGSPIGNGEPGPVSRRLREIYVDFARAPEGGDDTHSR